MYRVPAARAWRPTAGANLARTLGLMTTDSSIAAQVLEAWGASAEPVATSSKEESDWIANLDGCRLLIEEKTKFDEPASEAARDAALAADEPHGGTLPLSHNNRISGIVGKAARQLDSSATDVDHDFKVLWFTGVGFDAEAKFHQVIATLYGLTRVFEIERKGMKECYFFRNADFFRYRATLDGAIVGHLQGHAVTMKLCLNPYSKNWQALRDSPYARQFPTGLIDPVAEEERGEAYVADCDIDRNDKDGVLRFLERKYSLERAMNMDMNLASVAIRLPR
jgi:hypothetical protein